MTETNVFELTQPGTFSDPLTEVFAQWRENAIGAGRRSRGCGLAQHPYRQVDR